MKNIKKISLESKIAILVAVLIAVLIAILAQVFTREYTLQYLEDGELKTETFDTREGFNERAKELQADSIKYWLNLNN